MDNLLVLKVTTESGYVYWGDRRYLNEPCQTYSKRITMTIYSHIKIQIKPVSNAHIQNRKLFFHFLYVHSNIFMLSLSPSHKYIQFLLIHEFICVSVYSRKSVVYFGIHWPKRMCRWWWPKMSFLPYIHLYRFFWFFLLFFLSYRTVLAIFIACCMCVCVRFRFYPIFHIGFFDKKNNGNIKCSTTQSITHGVPRTERKMVGHEKQIQIIDNFSYFHSLPKLGHFSMKIYWCTQSLYTFCVIC